MLFQGTPKQNQRGSPRKGKYRRQRIHSPSKEYHSQSSDQPSADIDFHENFPPLPKSVKPAQSPILQKITQSSAFGKEQPAIQTGTPTNSFEPHVIGSRPPSSCSLQGPTTYMKIDLSHIGTDIEVDYPSYRSSIHGTPSFPRPPPPSSAELSTAGNTAPTTPTAAYVRPRITPQTFHDRLLRAHANLATLQEGHPLAMASTPVSPSLDPTIEQGRNWMVPEAENSDILVANVQRKGQEGWVGNSMIEAIETSL